PRCSAYSGRTVPEPPISGREVLELGQPIPYGQHRLGIVDVKGGGECHTRYRRGINIHHAQWRMVGHEMTAAFRAVLPVAHARFHEWPTKPAPVVTLTFSG